MLGTFGRNVSVFRKIKCQDIRKAIGEKCFSVKSNRCTLLLRNCKKNVQSCNVSRYNSNQISQSRIESFYDPSATVMNESERKEFMVVFEDILGDMVIKQDDQYTSDVVDRFQKIVKYTIPGQKFTRAAALMKAYRTLASEQERTPENIRLSIIMALCVQMMESSFQIIDDIMVGSTMKKTRPPWCCFSNIGEAAVYDADLVEGGVYEILKKYFSDKPYYLDTIELFHDVTFKDALGQTLDINVAAKGSGKVPDLSTYTMERYRTIVKYKICNFECCFPFTLAMYMAGLKNEELLRQGKNILMEIGQFAQVQDDYLDCFGDPAVTGKIGTDIETRKCTWLIATAMQRATPEQKAVLEDCYGCKDPLKVAKVKEVYEELDLHSAFNTFVQDRKVVISSLIHQLPNELPKQLFYDFMLMLRM
ncbi:farnesyl pyrophosphate synthase-like [Periplaneta americana]|uniref:farnesyl pyrophosphate synthase-like n=1 Tax=Periplaneta americana TaxID=6978 RepID=UPI0037E8F538